MSCRRHTKRADMARVASQVCDLRGSIQGQLRLPGAQSRTRRYSSLKSSYSHDSVAQALKPLELKIAIESYTRRISEMQLEIIHRTLIKPWY
jgi:hypothetical protein